MELIKNWTDALRYQPYCQWDKQYQKLLTETVNHSKWRQNYHIQAESGLLNDPNGFSYFNGQWHLFYQIYPMGPVHGVKSWYHVSSDNLVDWQPEGFALLPDMSYDSHGVYSGSGIVIEDELILAYTGNVRDQDWQRTSYQMLAAMNKQGEITKEDKPFISAPPKGYTHEFRDPQVFKYQEQYWLLIGAQTDQLEGKVLAYAGDTLEKLEFKGELHFTDQSMGFMVECPNLVFIEETPVLLFCPQGLDQEALDYQNIYPNTYIVAESFDTETLTLTQPTALKNLDEGFDVYATQAFNAPDGRALAVSWVGMPETAYPSDHEGWAHCLSIVKELKLKNGHLYQTPIKEQVELRQEQTALAGELTSQPAVLMQATNNCYEVILKFTAGSQGKLHLFADHELNLSLVIDFDTKNGMIKVDRTNAGSPFAQEYGTTRSVSIEKNQPLTLQLFVDQSVCELFINGGQQVATARIFPGEGEDGLVIEGAAGSYAGDFWRLRSMKND
ncbi:sucrose-6-phosphate hydrolase [Candidatus Enterococcus ferrettii]|uniref:Sucrose-6-phosphate hydrolase n=1 Tax=Candidatus Enterococcus ferrettii TaxID=2815324 RepID=A0ABV0EN57_9ENTE|nr:sucrose-6-phosphate hydrolase [Enterococcus sp. 665A]MBO1339049.1 sucrose-6-phosphate hydrolase [Enterococcus sp. 665A]